jgi:signal transduction histidine kinase
MKLLSRLALAILAVCAGCALLYWRIHTEGMRELDGMMRELARERTARIDTAIRLQGAGLESLTSGYAWWNEMVKYMEKPDVKWAADNIDNMVGIPNGGDALWVLDPDLAPVHAIDKEYRRPALPFPAPETLRAAIGDRYTFRYLVRLDGAVWEIFGAAVQDASFWRHQTPVRGYLLLGKRWDEPWLAELERLIGAKVRLRPDGEPAPEGRPLHHLSHALAGLGGTTAAHLDARFNFELFEAAREAFNRRILLLSLGAAFAVALLVAAVAFFVLRPLSQITRSLESRLPTPLGGLLTARHEFGEIARLLAGQLRWGRMLQDEMRRTIDRQDPAAQRREAESNEALRVRLAGNLHDGPIQSIYAAGLQLTALQAEAEHGRAPAPAQVALITGMLQQASSDLRNIILDLEPEELRERDLESALHQLERHMRQFGRCEFRLEIGEGATDGLTREAQTQLYFICRELASNALRHARPTEASLRLAAQDGFLVLEWLNDGVKPRPAAAAARTGNGLRNIERRIREIDGTVEHGAHRGAHWRVCCEIPLSSLTTPPPRPGGG